MKRYLLIISAACFVLAGYFAHGQTYSRIGYAGLVITNVVGASQIGAGGGGEFTPQAGYFGYWDADDLTGSNNDAKLTWTYKSTNAWELAGSAVLKTSAVNGLKALWWGAATNGMTLGVPVFSTGYPDVMIHIVAKQDAAAPSANLAPAFTGTW